MPEHLPPSAHVTVYLEARGQRIEQAVGSVGFYSDAVGCHPDDRLGHAAASRVADDVRCFAITIAFSGNRSTWQRQSIQWQQPHSSTYAASTHSLVAAIFAAVQRFT
jgi:hypothetical protein